MKDNNVRSVLAYIAVATLAAGSDWLVFTAISWLRPGWDVLAAQAPARLTGGLVAFLMHRTWSFRNQQGRGLTTEARRFLSLYVFSFCVSLITVFLMVDVLALNRYWSKLAADLLCFVVNYIVMKLYVFSSAAGIAEAAGQLRPTANRMPDGEAGDGEAEAAGQTRKA